MNDVQGKMKDITRKMMAVVSELSMQQANAMQLQHNVRDKQQFLESCHLRMEQGLAPSEEFETEWLKMLDKENRRMMEIKMKYKVWIQLTTKSVNNVHKNTKDCK